MSDERNSSTKKPPFGCGPLAWRLFWGLFAPTYAAVFLTLAFFAAMEGR
jgi:hypothetical protein